MMDIMHSITNTNMRKIIFIILIISFLITGIGGYVIMDMNDYVVKINDTKITSIQLEKIFQDEKEILQQQLGNEFIKVSDNKELLYILRHRALERLIGMTLFKQHSKKLNLNISDEYIKNEIYNMPIFQTNTSFDKDKYKKILSTYHISADQLANEIKQNLINRYISSMYMKDEFILDNEIKQYAKLFLQTREIKSMKLDLKNYLSQQNVTDKEIYEYYSNHKKNFLSPKQVQINYIKLDIKSQLNKIKVTNKEIKDFYKKNITTFSIPEKKNYSMIQLDNIESANLVFKKLLHGESFDKLVLEKSIDKLSAANNGNIGWFDTVSTPHEILAANLTQKGQISKVIKFGKYYVIFRLNDIKEKKIKNFQSVELNILNIIKNQKATDQFHILEKKINNIIINNKISLNNIAKKMGIKLISTKLFDKNRIPKEINFHKLTDIIFNDILLNNNNPVGINSGIIKVDDTTIFIAEIINFKPEIIRSLKDVKNIIINTMQFNKAKISMTNDGNKILSAIKNNDKNILKKFNVHFNDRKIVKRFDQNNFLIDQIFEIPIPVNNIPSYASIQDTNNNLLLIQLIKVIPGIPNNNDLITLSNRYQIILGDIMMESMIHNLRNKAKIVMNASIE
uniref:Periplasmic chaperone PpiD n=1 Tax=Candidatus Aschnera chinzeii TaxID=1485666 RepID=A0AAT9G521_9ENTR|nr:MAG: peptidylprolyl isomerase [Candidatus Aschnera chinzeii]